MRPPLSVLFLVVGCCLPRLMEHTTLQLSRQLKNTLRQVLPKYPSSLFLSLEQAFSRFIDGSHFQETQIYIIIIINNCCCCCLLTSIYPFKSPENKCPNKSSQNEPHHHHPYQQTAAILSPEEVPPDGTDICHHRHLHLLHTELCQQDEQGRRGVVFGRRSSQQTAHRRAGLQAAYQHLQRQRK